MMIRYAIAAVVLLLGCSSWDDARAANCSNYPYTLQNGQTADANQVMANFNNVLNCTNANLLGASNNLSDVGSASASRINLGLGASAVENLGNNVVDDGSGNLRALNNLHVQVFTSSGTFTVPSLTTAATLFKITAVAGGGGGGGASGSNVAGGGGASGGYGIGWFSGLTASQTLAVVVGTGGTGGSSSGTGIGGAGGNTTVASPNSTTVMNCFGGPGGTGATSAGAAQGGQGRTTNCVISASGSGLTLVSSLNPTSQSGGFGLSGYASGAGGSNPIGSGGGPAPIANTLGFAGVFGGGSSGSASMGTGEPGTTSGSGIVIIEWVQ